MNSTKILFAVALIAFCCVNLSYTLKCFVCNSAQTCKKPELYVCNERLANDTRTYWSSFHTGVHPNASSPTFECFREYLKTTNGEIYYKGCAYTFADGCNLPLNPTIAYAVSKRDCKQCSGKDGCNPAGRINIEVMTVFVTVIIASLLRHLWH